ncbi:MAG: deoxynucleoside kinase [Bacteroidales bacterium]|nr:deoxynucleoside kinase [Bacteroidales bacterium]
MNFGKGWKSRYTMLLLRGNIGAGKTTLVTRIYDEFNARLILEHLQIIPFFQNFTAIREVFLSTELSFLASRYRQLKEELCSGSVQSFTIADYYFMKSLVFASSTLDGESTTSTDRSFILFTDPAKAGYLCLSASYSGKTVKKIKRGRNYENNITKSTFRQFRRSYFTFSGRIARISTS